MIHLMLGRDECTDARLDRACGEGIDGIVLPISTTRTGLQTSIDRIQKAGMSAWGYLMVGRDEQAAGARPDWLHTPPRKEWLQSFSGWEGATEASVWPWISVNNVEVFDYAVARIARLLNSSPGLDGFWLAGIQGAPPGCGCGAPICRSWDSSYGPKIATGPDTASEIAYTQVFIEACRDAVPFATLRPVLMSERAVLDGACPDCRAAHNHAWSARLHAALAAEPLLGEICTRELAEYNGTGATIVDVELIGRESSDNVRPRQVVFTTDAARAHAAVELGAAGAVLVESEVDWSWRPTAAHSAGERLS